MTDHSDSPVPLESILCTEELERRPSRPPDFEKENRALVALTQALGESPQTILQKLADTILEVLRCGSAGISLLTTADGGKNFYWPAIAGAWKSHIGGGTPRDFGPCGDVLDCNRPLLFRHVERRYTYFQPVQPVVEEALLVPFYLGGKAVGTIWAVAHDPSHKFDAEDRRQLLSLGQFASAAYSAVTSLDASQQYAAIVECSDDAIISKNLDGIIQSWNGSAERLFGYTAKEAVGQHITLIVPPERRDEETQILEKLRRGERVDHFETVRMRKDGARLDISLTISPVKNSSGQVIGASKVARNISYKKRAERELRESEERFRAIVDTTPECVKLVAADGTLLQMNSSGLAMVGADCAEMVVGKNIYNVIVPEHRERYRAFNERICSGEKGTLEFDIRSFDGSLHHMETHAAPLRIADGTVVQLAVTRDLSERKKAEAARQESVLSARLLKVQDAERRRIARELHDGAGNLLAGIAMNVGQVLKEEDKLSPETARCARENSILIGRAVAEIRTVSYLLHPPLLDEVGLQSAIKWYVDGFTERSKINVTLELAPDLPRLSEDYELSLFRVVQECLTNVHRHSGSFTALVRLNSTPRAVTLEIKDGGRGIPEEILSKLDSGASVGVGFRGMQERVNQIGGTFEVRSNGEGTSILVTLPLNSQAFVSEERIALDPANQPEQNKAERLTVRTQNA
ncbi:MAG: PAS domain S-box protein [Candidatus Acidiferrum sp.]